MINMPSNGEDNYAYTYSQRNGHKDIVEWLNNNLKFE